MSVRHATVAEIEEAPNLAALLAEYAAESANDEIGSANPQIDTYKAMEGMGLLQAFGAYCGRDLVGFLFLLLPVLPHFGRKVGVTESYFVASHYRSTGAGLALLREAEKASEAAGGAGVLVSAPVDGILSRVLPGVGYRETNRVFFKGFK
nr:conserved hypothetical protein, putative phage acetyltransferase [blood disease bacterium R229]